MAIRLAINGYGRIGRNILRALYESRARTDLEIVAINDLAAPRVIAHVTQYDSVHGKFKAKVSCSDSELLINDDVIALLSEADPEKLPWKEQAIDIVLECTGLFTDRDCAELHLKAGAKHVIVSAPGDNMDATIVYGVNHQKLDGSERIISNASCTTNCLAPLAQVLHQGIGIVRGTMTTIHAYTNDQQLTDESHDDLYRARAATQSLIPTRTGAASSVGLVLPELDGKLDGMAIRVPTINVSVVDFHFIVQRPTTVDEVNRLLKRAADGHMKEVLAYNDIPLVSIDFNHNPASAIFDAAQTVVNGNLVKVMAWYDNEWGFSNRMLDTARALMLVT